MLRLTRPLGLGTEVPVAPDLTSETPAPPVLPSLSLPILSNQDFQTAQGMRLCPHWQRLTIRGTCVDDWWVGPPLSWVSAALITTAGMAVIGWALVLASKVSKLQPAVSKIRKVVKAPTWED